MELNQTALNIMAIITIALCVYVGFLLIKESKSDKQLQAKISKNAISSLEDKCSIKSVTETQLSIYNNFLLEK
mgnify:CR=1 FL=1